MKTKKQEYIHFAQKPSNMHNTAHKLKKFVYRDIMQLEKLVIPRMQKYLFFTIYIYLLCLCRCTAPYNNRKSDVVLFYAVVMYTFKHSMQ